MSNRFVWWIPVCVWCILIFTVTALPASTSKNTASIIKVETHTSDNTVHKIDYVVRKSAHITIFGSLAVLILIAIGKRKNAALFAWTLATLCGVLDEVHQIFTPGRTPSVLDVGIDSAGAAAALILCGFYISLRSSRIGSGHQ